MTDKTIDTLIPDIYDVVENGVDDDNGLIDAFSAELGDQLKKRLIRSEHQQRDKISLSGIGQCIRKQWYRAHGYQGEKLEPWTHIKFIYGDLIEALVVCLAKMAGHEVRGEQDVLYVEGVKGHRDAVIDGHTVDIKSASKYGFQKFVDGTVAASDSFGYIDQLTAYTEGASDDVDKSASYNLAVAKEMGKLALFELKADDMPDIKARVRDVVAACGSDTPPDRPYAPLADGKSGNMKLGVACAYCPHQGECWKEANDGIGLRTFLYSNGPRFLTTVAREPDVREAS